MTFRSRLQINLGLFKENIQSLRTLVLGKEILFMAKAEAYGHGMIPLVRCAVEEMGINEIGLATVEEALAARTQLPDLKYDIYIFTDVSLFLKQKCSSGLSREIFTQHRCIPVITSLADLKILFEERDLRNVPLCIKVNTGMNRLGIKLIEIEESIKLIKNSGRQSIHHLMTHLACASDLISENAMNIRQKESFEKIKSEMRGAGIKIERTSIANSGAIEQNFGMEESHVRPGLMLYGPTGLSKQFRSASKWRGKNISRLETSVISTMTVNQGDLVGYGATPCPSKGFLVFIGMGYGDGLSLKFQNVSLSKEGFHARFLGRVSMDTAQILFPIEADKFFKVGDQFILWGNDTEDVLSFADQMGTIPYELFCQLTTRVSRNYSI